MSDVVRVMNRDEAVARVLRVRAHVEQAWDDLIALHTQRAWIALGYESWDGLCEAEFDGARIALPRDDRREVVGQMREAGMSIPAIASATGASIGTIHNDLSQLKGSGRDLPTEVTGLDGRVRPAKVTTRTSESTTIEVDRETGEIIDGPGMAGRAAADAALSMIALTPEQEDAFKFERNFSRSLSAAAVLLQFPATRCADVADDDLTHVIDSFDRQWSAWIAEFRSQRKQGLRLVREQ